MIRDVEPTYARLGLEAHIAPESEYLGAVMGDAAMTLPTTSIMRFAERFAESGEDPQALAPSFGDLSYFAGQRRNETMANRPLSRLMDPAEANLAYGHLGLKFTAPVREGVAELMAESKRREAAYRQVYERARIDGNLSLGAKALGVAGEFMVNAADPLNVASAFVPIVSQARWAQWALRMGAGPARAARGALEGAVGQALIEPLLYASLTDEQMDYTALNSFTNIVFGAGLGGGLHWLGGYGRDIVRGPWRAEDLRDMAAGRPLVSDPIEFLDSPDVQRVIQASALREAIGQFAAPAAAVRAAEEATGFHTADYRVPVDGYPSMFRSRFEPPEPWGYTLERLAPETRENLIRTAVAQAVDDRRIDVEPVARVDPSYVQPPANLLRWLNDASPAALRWALQDTPEGFKLESKKFGQRVRRSLLPTRSREALLTETRDHMRIMETVREALASMGVTSNDYKGFDAPLLTAPGGYIASSDNMRFAMILKGEEKPPGTLFDWIKELGGIRDDGGELAARDVKPGRKGVPPGVLRKTDGEGGLLLADLAQRAVEDGWIPEARKTDDWEAHIDNQDYLPTDRMADMIAAGLHERVYHPESDYPAAKARADDLGELLAEHGLDAKTMKAADLAYLADNPEVLGRLQEWRYVAGLLDEVQSEEVALRLWDEIEREHVKEMSLAIEMYRADTGRERPEGFEPDIEGEGRALTAKEWEAVSAEVDKGLAEYEGTVARARARERDEGGAVVVAADAGATGKGGAADNGKTAAAGKAGEGAGAEGQGIVVIREGRPESHGRNEFVDDFLKKIDPEGKSAAFVDINPPSWMAERMRADMARARQEAVDVNRAVGYTQSGRVVGLGQGTGPYEKVIASGKPVVLFLPNGEARVFNLPKQDLVPVVIEKTDQGMQTVLPGAERITPEEMNARIVAKGIADRLTAGVKQDVGFGLFDVQGRGQGDLLNLAPMSDVDALIKKYGADPASLVSRLEEMRAERSELSTLEGGADRLRTLQKRIADGETALAEIQRRDQQLRDESEPFIRRQGSKENDALIEPKNPVMEAYAKVVDEGADEVALKAEVERLEAEMGDRVTAEEREIMGEIDRQASDFEAAGMAYLFCKANS